eukprot:g1511.t1
MAPWPLWLTSWLYAGHRPEREQGRPDLSRGSFLTRLRSADGEDTGDAARVQCKALLVPGGAYATYDNSELLLALDKSGNFLTSYDLELKAPNWSAYYITPEETRDEHGGRRSFKSDPAIPPEHQEPLRSKCWGQKWNRGHLCPSYIMSYDKKKNGPWDDTYFITNTAMQYGPFNQQTWKHTVEWVTKNKKPIFIVTGTIFNRDGVVTKCNLNTGEITPPAAAHARASRIAEQPVLSSASLSSPAREGRDEDDHELSPQEEVVQDRLLDHDDTDTMGVPDFYYKIMCDAAAKKSIAHLGHNRADDLVHEMSVADLEKKIGLQLLPADGCGTAEMDSEYWWTEALGNLKMLRKTAPEELREPPSSWSSQQDGEVYSF